jgi:hypothetical protein
MRERLDWLPSVRSHRASGRSFGHASGWYPVEEHHHVDEIVFGFACG